MFRQLLVLATLLVVVAGCGTDRADKAKVDPKPPPPETELPESGLTTTTEATTTTADVDADPSGWIATTESVHGLTPGMTPGQAGKVLKTKLAFDSVVGDGTCQTAKIPDNPEGVTGYLLFENNKLGAVFLDGGKVETGEGIKLGTSKIADVKLAYPDAKSEPAPYTRGTDFYIQSQLTPETALRIETLPNGKVKSIDVGARAVHYIEGCA